MDLDLFKLESGADAPASRGAGVPVAETFLSIQGEGKLAGVPSFFIRVSGCNLRCGWCDTPYASWRPEGEIRAIESLAQEAVESGARHTVVTGGEPMMFAATSPLTRLLARAGLHVTIETAGTMFDPAAAPRADLMSISPKLASSTPRDGDPRDSSGHWRARHESRRLNLEALQGLIDAYPSRQLKFVFCGPGDIDEVESILARLTGWADDDVMLMPEGVAPPSPEARRELVAACLQKGWRYCPRLHIELFGNVRGT